LSKLSLFLETCAVILQRNVFDDHSSEIQEMTLVVKQKLGLFHNKLKKLQDLKDSHRGWTQSQVHSPSPPNVF